MIIDKTKVEKDPTEISNVSLKVSDLIEKAKKNQDSINLVGTISLCCIMKDEENNIKDFIECWASFVDEICLVDTGCTDDTIHIAKKMCEEKKLQLKIREFEWCDDFAAARNVSLKMAGMEWIIWSDADDRITAEAGSKIRRVVVEQSQTTGGILVTVRSEKPDTHIDEIAQLRLFKRNLNLKFENPIHECLPQKTGTNNFYVKGIVIDHIGYKDPELLKIKAKRNDRIIEQNLDKTNLLFFYGKKFESLGNSKGDHWKAMGVYLYMLTKEDLGIQLKNQITYLIGRIFLKMNEVDLAISWLEQSEEMDAKFYLAKCHEFKKQYYNAKTHYGEYILVAENGVPTFGSLRKSLLPEALKKCIELSENELEHWKKFELMP